MPRSILFIGAILLATFLILFGPLCGLAKLVLICLNGHIKVLRDEYLALPRLRCD